MPIYPKRKYPGIMRHMLALHEPPALKEARERVNTYKRESLRAAFDSGWYACARGGLESDADSNPLLSSMAASAWKHGYRARVAYNSSITQES